MAEFQEVMRQYQRMCKDRECKDCPLGISSIKDCFCQHGYISTLGHFEETEEIVMLWAAEHPEPVYPTWKEWLEEQRVVVHFDSVSEKGTKVKWELTNKSNCHIPADIAQKLGIEPKE